jgi:hypothetical protein
MVQAFAVLDLGDDRDGSTALPQEVADVLYVLGPLHEGRGDVVDAVLHGEAKIGLVGLVETVHQDGRSRDVDALVVAEFAAAHHHAAQLVRVVGLHAQLEPPVVDADRRTRLHLSHQVRIGDGDSRGVAQRVTREEREVPAGLEQDLRVLHGPGAHLGALGVQHAGHGYAELPGGAAKHFQAVRVSFVALVGEVEAGHVHARLDHAREGIRV